MDWQDDEAWNRRERDETELQRLDRNFDELLQELRVAQAGVQILFAFLLTLTFTQRFASVSALQRAIYFMTLLLTAAATSLLIAPVSMHRLLFRHHQKPRLVVAANRLAICGLLSLCLAMVGVLLFITDVLYGHVPAVLTALLALAWFGVLWFALPLRWLTDLRRRRGPGGRAGPPRAGRP
jgi:Family of unknown function (DUF6328)